ncbi:hypothetical protein GGR55DRAFT_528786 [Xylaria sp. FL0064]|nr:hypothetical protein GGR55DRAFT_528786 [Xylaria sp. FL0064]
MNIGIKDLSDDLVVSITNVLARRPEYGIATPSPRWLQRQEEKIKHVPKELLRPSGLKRLAIKIVDSIDPNIIDPQAVLCKTHSALNPFLIRRLFIAVAYEVTVYTDILRLWQSQAQEPGLSAMVGRLDSIVALWTPPQLFHDIYGHTPFDAHHVFVKSGCEACCLAAIGASGRALADLRAALVDRMERRMGTGEKSSGKKPRLYRIVEAWIDQLRKKDESENRAEQCRAMSEALLTELRRTRHQLKAWRAQQHDAGHRPVYNELKITPSGAQIAPVSRHSGHHRRTRDGIPIAVVDVNGTEGLRRAAKPPSEGGSIYRPDSISGYSQVLGGKRGSYDSTPSAYPQPTDPRPAARGPPQEDGFSEAGPTPSFLHRFEQEMSIHDDYDPPVDVEDNEQDEKNYMEKSRSRVEDWFTNKLSHTQVQGNGDFAKSKLYMVHPAFRSASVAHSAMPTPLRLKKDCEVGQGGEESTVWTDCSVYTIEGPWKADTEVPPVPKIPSQYRHGERSGHRFSHKHHDRSGDPAPTNWPAPPTNYNSIGVSEQYLRERFKPRYEDVQENPPISAPTSTAPSTPRPVSSIYSMQSSTTAATSISPGTPTRGDDERARRPDSRPQSGKKMPTDRSSAAKRTHDSASRHKSGSKHGTTSGSKSGGSKLRVPEHQRHHAASVQPSTVATQWDDFIGKM